MIFESNGGGRLASPSQSGSSKTMAAACSIRTAVLICSLLIRASKFREKIKVCYHGQNAWFRIGGSEVLVAECVLSLKTLRAVI